LDPLQPIYQTQRCVFGLVLLCSPDIQSSAVQKWKLRLPAVVSQVQCHTASRKQESGLNLSKTKDFS
jgi:hypothetical protein